MTDGGPNTADAVVADAWDGEDEESLPPTEPDRGKLLEAKPETVGRVWDRVGLIRLAFLMAWRAARWRGLCVALAQTVAGLGIGAQLLAGNRLLTQALEARSTGRSLTGLIPGAVAFTGIGALLAVMNAASRAQSPVINEQVGLHANREIMATAGTLKLAAFENAEFYNRLQRAVAQGQIRPLLLTQNLMTLAGSTVGSLGIGLALYALQPALVPFAFLSAIPTWMSTKRNLRGQFIVIAGNTPDERERSYLQSLLTQRDPAKEVRAFNLVDYLRERYERVSARIVHRKAAEARRTVVRSLLGSLGAGLASGIGGAALLWLLVEGRIPIASAFTAALAMQQLRSRVNAIALNAASVYESALYLQDYASFIAERPPATGDHAEVAPFTRLAAERVSFRYPGVESLALDEVDVEIRAGEVVALVGENGSGKTTLAKLLCTLYDATDGTVTWDGIDVRDHDPAALREHITVIFQDFVRYALPARDNVVLGRHERAGDADAFGDAIRLAGMEGTVKRLPDGPDTILGRQFSGGQDLSGGQWQRLALARAFFRDAPFLVLDEPTASLDARAEHRLFQRIRELARGRAVLLITHRFGNVRMADRIYVLHHGRVEESGTHTQLMASRGRYAELFTLQASQFLDQAPEAAR